MIHAMDAIAAVFGYIACTVPCVGLLVWILQLRSVHAREFQVALFLQLLPVGLLYWPLGVPGVAILGSCIWRGGRRMRQFRGSGLYNPSVEKAWSLEQVGALLAFGLACEQKAFAWLFLEVSSHRGWGVLWGTILPASVFGWLAIALLVRRERLTLKSRLASTEKSVP